MAEKYIKASECEKYFYEHLDDSGMIGAMNAIDEMSAADVQPVKRGHWYHNTSKYISELDAYFIQACCSCCGRYSDRIDQYSEIMSNETCSHCGADMREHEPIKG